jgi:hypothetical protein
MREQRIAAGNLPRHSVAQRYQIHLGNHQPCLPGKMLVQCALQLFSRGQVNIAIGQINRRAVKAAVRLELRPLLGGQKFIGGAWVGHSPRCPFALCRNRFLSLVRNKRSVTAIFIPAVHRASTRFMAVLMVVQKGRLHHGHHMIELSKKCATMAGFGIFLSSLVAFAAPPAADYWEIGPVIRGRNYSVGLPLQPMAMKGGWIFQFPNPTVEAGHVHYLTFVHGSLAGKRRIVLRYRIDAARGTRFIAREFPDQAPAISLFFQRSGDSWSAKRRYAGYRWYGPYLKMTPVAVGTHQISVDLSDPDWISVMGAKPAQSPDGFASAIAETERVGFVFGSGSARGHGVYATGPAKFTLLEYRVE